MTPTADRQVLRHPCAYCGTEILKKKKTYCGSTCRYKAKYQRERGHRR
jgi:hypothetical protein